MAYSRMVCEILLVNVKCKMPVTTHKYSRWPGLGFDVHIFRSPSFHSARGRLLPRLIASFLEGGFLHVFTAETLYLMS